MTIRDLLTVFSFEVKDQPLEAMEKRLAKIQHTLEFLAAAEVVKGIVEMTEKFAHFAEELHVAAENAGLTVEAFQKLSFAAGQNAVTQDEMGTAMARLSRHLYDARKGGVEAQKAFALAGFTAEQVNGFRTGSDAMLALSDRFSAIHDPIAKQAIAMELLGRGSYNMVAFLSKGSGAIKGLGNEAQRLGVVLGHQQVEALVRVEHAFIKVFAIVKALGATFASYFAPSIESAVKEFLKFYEVNKKILDTSMRQWVYDVTYALGFLWGAVKFVAQGFFDFAKSHEVLVRRATEFLVALGALAGGIFLVSKGVGLLQMGFQALMAPLRVLSTVFGSTFGVAALAIGGIVVAVHDIWNGLQGKPTWMESFFEFLGIADKVQAVCFSIFDIISDILSLNFSKLGSDLMGDVKGVGHMLGGVGNWLGITKAADNMNSAQNMNANPVLPGASTSVDTSSSQYSVSAPITIQVPSGTDPKEVGKQVKEGVKEHMDRVYREAHRSLRGVQAY